ncbi:MAG: hypothetical protein MJZ68_10210 [archaeon]|nr:hypothetical protein [archaeon]
MKKREKIIRTMEKAYRTLEISCVRSKRTVHVSIPHKDDRSKSVTQTATYHKNAVIVLTWYPDRMEGDDLIDVADRLMKTNRDLIMGSYDLKEDGSLTFRSTVYTSDTDYPDKAIFERHFALGFVMMEKLDEILDRQDPAVPPIPAEGMYS